ncbi:helix-turn-helix domain-containing protein [Methylorubrum extorquens]|uniref:Transcriptional regulator, XRE family n=1 Tax=Methylorubrum extorquens (strain CM4 / NCIMB 13688) TaxID=440085 RepID=B7L1T5_METC4|nr:XRE family transcriptional regulator [Methylorubrum extorquens]ACK81479.1 transcriptional regulator, XRE family [Methylorubrum extorquens CM4]
MLNTASNAPSAEERPLEKALGHQIRRLRRERDLSLSDLSSAADVSQSMISKIEHGAISPSLASINAIASALNVPITALFAAFEETRDCSHVKHGQGVPIERHGTKSGHLYQLLGGGIRNNVVVQPYLITLTKEAEQYTGFQHDGTELIFVLNGEVVYHHSGQDYHLEPGDALMFDANGLHGPSKILKAPVTYLAVISN